MKEVYLAISQRIAQEIGKVKRVTLYNQQLANLADEYAVDPIEVFIAFESVEWTDSGRGQQTGSVLVGIYVVHQRLADPDHGSYNQDQALENFDTLDQLQQVLQGFSTEFFGPMSRVATEFDISHDHLVLDYVSYQLSLTDECGDTAASLIELQTPPDIRISRELDHQLPTVASSRPPVPAPDHPKYNIP